MDKKSATVLAYERHIKDGITLYEAAKREGISASAVYAYRDRRNGKHICQHCNQVIRKVIPK
jgi:DNA-binding CsgD family transcriptional regulator